VSGTFKNWLMVYLGHFGFGLSEQVEYFSIASFSQWLLLNTFSIIISSDLSNGQLINKVLRYVLLEPLLDGID
jgi:hypothetical protein